jgi:AmmeMemoRadiSam system protein B
METRRRFLPAGWYPDSEKAVRREIEDFKDYIDGFDLEISDPRGGIVPHAGWYFSGRLAALVMSICAQKKQPDVVAIFGGHLGPGSGVIYNDQAWDTPMGPAPIDREMTEALAERFRLSPAGPATNDNTVEVQVPLVRYFFPESRLVALRAPHSEEAAAIGRTAAQAAGNAGKSLLAFGSTDLTHYGPNYGFAPKGSGQEAVRWVTEVNDKEFIEKALALDEKGMLEHAAANSSACSAGGAAAAAAAAEEMGAGKGVLADYYTTHDIMPGPSFVGYAGIVY